MCENLGDLTAIYKLDSFGFVEIFMFCSPLNFCTPVNTTCDCCFRETVVHVDLLENVENQDLKALRDSLAKVRATIHECFS